MDGSILIVDDVATNRIVLKAKLSAARYHPILAASGSDGLRMARQDPPDLIMLDLRLPDMSGIEVLTTLRADPLTRNIPVIVLSATTSLQDRLDAFAAGADEVFPKPCPDGILLARVRNLLRGQQELAALNETRHDGVFGLAEEAPAFQPPGVLAIVTDRKDVALRLRRDLAPLMRDQIISLGTADALGDPDTAQAVPDIYLVDGATDPAGEWGRRLLSDLRSRGPTRNAAICLMARRDGVGGEAGMAFDLGANDIIDPSMGPPEMVARLRTILRRKRLADKRRETVQDGLRLAVIDPVTGLHNRRYGLARLTTMVQEHANRQQPIAVIIADLDHFKQVNDRFGHAAGDHVLVEVARALQGDLRQQDLLARLGGEEFLIALPDTRLQEAGLIAQRLRLRLEQHPIRLATGKNVQVTASFGLAVVEELTAATRHEAEHLALELIEEADTALLSAKATGRNMVIIARKDVA